MRRLSLFCLFFLGMSIGTAYADSAWSVRVESLRDNLLKASGFTIPDVLIFPTAYTSALMVGLGYQFEVPQICLEAEFGISKTSSMLLGWPDKDEILPIYSFNFSWGNRLTGAALGIDTRIFLNKHIRSNVIPMISGFYKGFGLSFLYPPPALFNNEIVEQYYIGLSYVVPVP